MDDHPGPFSSPPAPPPPGDEIERQRPAVSPAPPPAAPAPRRRSRWRIAGWLLFLVLVVGGVAWVVLRAERQPAQTGRFTSTGPMPVGTAEIAKGDMPIALSALGTVVPLAMVTVKTQINGQLIEVGYKEGQMVNKGDFLAQIDPRPYQVALAQAQGQLARDTALLRGAEVDLARYKTLAAQNSIARQTLDTQTYLVEQDRGIVQADQAQVDNQLLNLTYCRIVAPVSGRVGLRQVDPGNYVQTSDAAGIVVITQVQPISVIFTLPEDSLQPVLKRFHGGASLAAEAFDRSGSKRLETGTLSTIDNQIDTTTGTVKLRATFDNAAQVLFPNQFVNIRLLVDTLQGVAIAPAAAIQRGAPGTFVYVVKPDQTVTAAPVTLGPSDNQRVAVTKGLIPGQSVVVDGADRLKEGAKVTLNQPEGGPAAAPGGAPGGRARPNAGAAPAPGGAAGAGAAPAAPRPDGAADRPQRQQGGQ